MTRLKADLTLLLAAFMWGSGFVAQRYAAARVDAFTFNGWRFLIAALMILVVTRVLRVGKKQQRDVPRHIPVPREQIPWMVLAGALLFSASGLQQAGLATTSISNASFITGLYVVIVPLILSLIWRHSISWFTWGAVGFSVIGVMMLSLQGELRIAPGDALELASAGMWSLQIILIGWLSSKGADVLHFSIIQFATCGLLNLGVSAALHGNGAFAIESTWFAILYSALFPIALGFSLQIAGQRHAPPVDASLIMSSEAVFGTLFGYWILGEGLTPQQFAGCALIMGAIVLAQLRPGKALDLNTAA